MAINGQYPRPWTTAMNNPEEARVLVIGLNPNKACLTHQVESHDAFIDAHFNRNGYSCDALYKQIGGHASSKTRPNLYKLREALSDLNIEDILETNAVCYSTPQSKDLKLPEHAGGLERGRKIFKGLLEIIRPPILIVHGMKANKELAKALAADIPSPAKSLSDGVQFARVPASMLGEPYKPVVFAVPSLALPWWNQWKNWAYPHLAEACAKIRGLLPIRHGFRVYRDARGQLHLDLISSGHVTPLRPEPEDEALSLGIYNSKREYLGPEEFCP